MKRKNFIYFLVALCLIAFIIYFFRTIARNSDDALKQMSIDSISLTHEYSNEYAKDVILPKEFVFKSAIYSKTRDPIEKFESKDAYCILYRLPIVNDKLISNIVKIKNGNLTQDNNVGYYDLTVDIDVDVKKQSSYDIMYKPGKPQTGSDIYLTLSGTDFKVLKKTDSLYSCYIQMDKFGITYNDYGNADFFGKINPSSNVASLPMQFSFKKANGHYYCLLVIEKK